MENESTVRPICTESGRPTSSKLGRLIATKVPNFERLSWRKHWPAKNAMLAWHLEMETSEIRNVLSWPRPMISGFCAKDITCTVRPPSRRSPTTVSNTMYGGRVFGSSMSCARSPLDDVTWVGKAVLHNSHGRGLKLKEPSGLSSRFNLLFVHSRKHPKWTRSMDPRHWHGRRRGSSSLEPSIRQMRHAFPSVPSSAQATHVSSRPRSGSCGPPSWPVTICRTRNLKRPKRKTSSFARQWPEPGSSRTTVHNRCGLAMVALSTQ
mmetsp:Transcript_90046/g.251764  ORF Transcript_90046/g.251764 Transcript_90046/m.251764 type:complete len:264 (+) Transcript_90046:650-1441(+)